ncbi:MAG: hypothetical protein IGS38_19160 [Synechococcales cyanobacterium M58_A2018_015]|nr:hypothetical protein [Synechococcales cyanobacterium M58_A2018_015]
MEQNKANHPLQDILLAREHYFPATIVEMCDPEIVWTANSPWFGTPTLATTINYKQNTQII